MRDSHHPGPQPLAVKERSLELSNIPQAVNASCGCHRPIQVTILRRKTHKEKLNSLEFSLNDAQALRYHQLSYTGQNKPQRVPFVPAAVSAHPRHRPTDPALP